MSTTASTIPSMHPVEDSEWLKQLNLMVERLQILCNSPLLAHDPIAQSIFRDMALAPDMDEIDRQCDLLMVRINELVTNAETASYVEDKASGSLSGSDPARILLTL